MFLQCEPAAGRRSSCSCRWWLLQGPWCASGRHDDVISWRLSLACLLVMADLAWPRLAARPGRRCFCSVSKWRPSPSAGPAAAAVVCVSAGVLQCVREGIRRARRLVQRLVSRAVGLQRTSRWTVVVWTVVCLGPSRLCCSLCCLSFVKAYLAVKRDWRCASTARVALVYVCPCCGRR